MKPFIPLSHIISVKTLAMLNVTIFRRCRQILGNKLNLIRDDALYSMKGSSNLYYLKMYFMYQ